MGRNSQRPDRSRRIDETEEERADRVMRFQVALGVSVLIAVVIGVIVLLVLSAMRGAGRPAADPLSFGLDRSLMQTGTLL